jgi:hypothetical protein
MFKGITKLNLVILTSAFHVGGFVWLWSADKKASMEINEQGPVVR